MTVTIRRATPDDAATLSRLAARTFTETFGHPYPPEDLEAFLADAYAVAKQHLILSHPDYAVWLLEDDGEAFVTAAVGPCVLPRRVARRCELKRLYLMASHQRGGWGGRLFDTALGWLERDGPRTLWIGVWSGNAGAQRFYARRGYEPVGEYLFPVGRVQDLEFILRRPAPGAG